MSMAIRAWKLVEVLCFQLLHSRNDSLFNCEIVYSCALAEFIIGAFTWSEILIKDLW